MLLRVLLCSCLLLATANAKFKGQDYLTHDGDGKTYTYSERQVSQGGRNVKNIHSTYTDNSIHRNGANFGGASNVVIGNSKILSGKSAPYRENIMPRSPRDLYKQQPSNSVDFKDFRYWLDNRARIVAGHPIRQKKAVDEGNVAGEEELSRVKRWGLFGAKSNVENHHRTHTDNSIHMNNANFGRSSNVVVGHGNRLSKRSVDVEDLKLSLQERRITIPMGMKNSHSMKYRIPVEPLLRQKRWSFKLKSKVGNSHSTHTDNSIHANGADFGNSQNVVI